VQEKVLKMDFLDAVTPTTNESFSIFSDHHARWIRRNELERSLFFRKKRGDIIKENSLWPCG
jgi:hypothetical protein